MNLNIMNLDGKEPVEVLQEFSIGEYDFFVHNGKESFIVTEKASGHVVARITDLDHAESFTEERINIYGLEKFKSKVSESIEKWGKANE